MRILESILRKCFSLTPYELQLRRENIALPPATFDTVKLALAYYLASKRLVNFVQIGACDGVSGDSCHDFIKKGFMKAVLVEPIESSFRKLQRAYEGVPNLTCVQVAISAADCTAKIYKVKEIGKCVDPFWSTQLASFDKSHILAHGVPSAEIEEVNVPCLTLQSLLKKSGIDRLHFLQVDTEGFDAEIVKMALALPVEPECINFENVHLNHAAREDVFQKLVENGYLWSHDQWNSLAIHKDLIERWSSEVP